ncbi:MAG: M3 family oligoendopeptidase [Lachnospiraceae bacterium]|nr:M3 family oligoendopeptidase [Lachnospiraceae bacterium]
MKFTDIPYEKIDSDKIVKEIGELTEALKEAGSFEEAWKIHEKYTVLYNHVITQYWLVYIRHGIDTTDKFYDGENDFFDSVLPLLTNSSTKYKEVLFSTPFRAEFEEKLGPVCFKSMELAIKSFDEKIVPLAQEENELVSRYAKLIASAKIPFDGEDYNLSLMGKFTTSSDRDVRKRAWKAVSDYFLSVTDEIDEIYDKMVKNRTAQAREMGYENYIPLAYMRMNRNSYGREQVENFRKQVKEAFVPLATMIHEKRRQRIGVDALKYYDNGVFFTNGNPAPIGTPEEILAAGQNMYRELSPETAEFIDFMREYDLFDVLGRKTKQQGGYMTFLPDYKAPFIFANFNGTSGDVDVITHECGHAFQGYITRNDPIPEHNDITMETAEIHSMSMEYFTYGWMEKFFGDRKDDYYTMHLEDSIIFVPYGCMVDEFQHIVYENPDMTPAERKQVWKDLEKTYRPHLDYDSDPFFSEGGYWQRQSHIFQNPFYYIDYVLASVCAMQFKVRMDEDFRGAFEDYLKLCKLSATKFYEPMLKEASLRSPFEDGCIEELVEALKKKI